MENIRPRTKMIKIKVIMQGKLFQRRTHLFYCSVLAASDTRRTLMHLFLFTNSAQRQLVSICMQSISNCNELSLHYNLGYNIFGSTYNFPSSPHHQHCFITLFLTFTFQFFIPSSSTFLYF